MLTCKHVNTKKISEVMKRQNRIIVFANQKGGVGKTTLCTLFADFLVKEGEPVAVIDADIQQTIFEQRRDELAEAGTEETPWDVVPLDTTVLSEVEEAMAMAKDFPGTILIDTPGNVSEDNLLPIYLHADYIICPMSYHPNVVKSTKKFALIMDQIKKSLGVSFKLWFVPNMIDERRTLNAEENKLYAWKELHMHGTTLFQINNRAWLERTSTLSMTSQQWISVRLAFGLIKAQIESIEEENHDKA